MPNKDRKASQTNKNVKYSCEFWSNKNLKSKWKIKSFLLNSQREIDPATSWLFNPRFTDWSSKTCFQYEIYAVFFNFLAKNDPITSWAWVLLMKYPPSLDFCLFAAQLLKIQHLCIKDTSRQLQLIYSVVLCFSCCCRINCSAQITCNCQRVATGYVIHTDETLKICFFPAFC